MNPDPVFFQELDHKLIKHLRELGADVKQIELKDLHI